MSADLLFYFFLGFSIAIFIYARSANIAAREFNFKVEKKEYQRRKMLARISGRFNDFEIIEKYEDKEN